MMAVRRARSRARLCGLAIAAPYSGAIRVGGREASMRLLSGLLAGILSALALMAPAAAEPAPGPHVATSLVADHAGIAPGQTIHLALRQQIQPHWHTYWKNPGDSGEPPRLAWTLPAGFATGDTVWPTPGKIPVGPLMNYGYEGEVLLPIP